MGVIQKTSFKKAIRFLDSLLAYKEKLTIFMKKYIIIHKLNSAL